MTAPITASIAKPTTKSIIKRVEKNVENTIKQYNLISKKDLVLVACSGGKDSTTCLYVLKKLGYNLQAITIDLGIGEYSRKNIRNIEKFCQKENIILNKISIRQEFGTSICYIKSVIQSKAKLNNCTICGVIKRWLLNKKARELRATKLATGHNLDDESETILMNLFKGNPGLGLGPKTGIIKENLFVQRIKPLYFCTNEMIRQYSLAMGFPVVYEPCPCSEGVFRRKIRQELKTLEKNMPNLRKNLVLNYLNTINHLSAKHSANIQMNYCTICGEPARNELCRRCSLIRILHTNI